VTVTVIEMVTLTPAVQALLGSRLLPVLWPERTQVQGQTEGKQRLATDVMAQRSIAVSRGSSLGSERVVTSPIPRKNALTAATTSNRGIREYLSVQCPMITV